MKTITKIGTLAFLLSFFLLAVSCEKDEVVDGGDNNNEEQIIFEGNIIGNGAQEFEITGTHTLKKGTYVLRGWVYITDGATLTIEPGTVIKGDKATKAALIVERGGKLFAEGTKEQPIVFTSNQPAGSRKPGDWGGIVICGKATNNKGEMIIEGGPRSKHGGSDDNDNSGVLKYVRIEFCGYPFKSDQEINGLTLGSVGNATKIEYVQVSFSNDDAFEWFGGTVDAKYLVSYNTWDDGFDTDSGYRGKVQFGLVINHPRIADISRSNGFESDNSSSAPNQQPVTAPVFSNITLIGPAVRDALYENNSSFIDGGEYNPSNGSKLGQHQSAVQIRRGSNLSLFNSVAVGYPVGLMINNDKGSQTQQAAQSGSLVLSNNIFAGMIITGSDKDGSYKDSLSTDASVFDPSAEESFSASFLKLASLNNELYTDYSQAGLIDPSNPGTYGNLAPAAASVLTGRSDLFVHEKLSSSFFEQTDFIGAFRSSAASDDWSRGWTEFDPQSRAY